MDYGSPHDCWALGIYLIHHPPYGEPIFLFGCNGLYGDMFLCIIGFSQLLIYTSKAYFSPRLILPCWLCPTTGLRPSSNVESLRLFGCPSLGCIKEIFIRKKRVKGPGGEGGAPPLVCFGHWRLLRVNLTGCMHHICTYLDFVTDPSVCIVKGSRVWPGLVFLIIY